MATKKSTGALTVWEQNMAAAVVKQASSEKSSSFKTISIRNGVLSVDDVAAKDNELLVVVLGAVHENCYYDVAFDPDTPAIPACFAFSEVDGGEDEMTPHDDASDKQHGDCGTCWANKMGSAEKGRGKACRNIRRLALITADSLENEDALNEAEVRMLKIPVMSTWGWAAYVKEKLAGEIGRPTWGVVTKVKVVPDKKAQFKVTFSFEEMVNFDQSLYDAMERKIKGASESLVAPYVPLPEEEAPPPPRGRGKPSAPPAKTVRPTGKMAEAMAKSAAKQGAANKAAPAKKAKY